MIANLLVCATALLSAAAPMAPMAAARAVTSAALPLFPGAASVGEASMQQGPMRRLHNQRQTARARRAEERRKRDEKERAERLCRRTGKCGGATSGGSLPSYGIVTVEEDEKQEVVSTPPPPPPPKPTLVARRSFTPPTQKTEARPAASSDKWVVCVSGNVQSWGPMTGRKPEGLTVYADGRCVLSEYAGGFDGFWSIDAGDGHEDGFASAVKGMLRDKGARVGASAGKQNPVNRRVNSFMEELRIKADPLDMDYPRDEWKADNGARMANIRKASLECTKMIEVRRC